MSLPGQVITVGTSILAQGVLQKILAPKKHVVELIVEKILHVGVVDVKSYPLTKPRISLVSLRDHPHLRPRSIAVTQSNSLSLFKVIIYIICILLKIY